MNTKYSVSRFLAISAIALAIPMASFAAGNDRNDRNDRGHSQKTEQQGRQGHMMPNLHGIDLTAAQVTQLTALRDEQKRLSSGKKQDMRDQHDALQKLVMSDAYTPAAAAEIITKISAAQTEMAKQHADFGNKFYKLLTPEQRTKVQQNELMGHGMMGRGHMR